MSVMGMVHVPPEAEGGILMTLMDRNVAYPPTHTRPHMSHTLKLSHNNLCVFAYTWTHKYKVKDGHAHSQVQPSPSKPI